MLYRRFIKRVFDLFFALLFLTILSPVILLLIIILLFSNRGKVFFVQQRPGLHARPFQIIKFKTMRDAVDASGQSLPDQDRITWVGNIIRSLSLDELLQLINVLKGEMSIVGPRPLLMRYVTRYNAKQSRRHEVKPGITGLAQVNGRNAISWEQKFAYDVEYVDRQSFWLDLRIIGLTIIKVLQRKDINASGKNPIGEFMGSA